VIDLNTKLQSKSVSQFIRKYSSKSFVRVFRRNTGAIIGLIMIVVLVGMVAGAPLLTPYHEPLRLVANPFIPPTLAHPMGTDDLGRDILSEVLYGASTSMTVGFFAAVTSVLIGMLVGAIAGYYGKIVDDALMRITELFQVIPNLLLALVAVAIIGPTIWNLIWVIGVTAWPSTARLVRAEFLTLRERTFVEAARGLGASNLRIMFGEILPNAMGPVIVNGSFGMAFAIILEAGLSFLGLGDPNIASLGRLLIEAQAYLRIAWWISFFPGLFIALIVLSLNLIGDGLNEALNPRLRER